MINRRKYYAGKWDGICVRCGQDYFANRGNTTCLACNAQRQGEIRDGLIFEEDLAAGENLTQLQAELGLDGPWYSQLQKLHPIDHRLKDSPGLSWATIAGKLGVAESTLYGWLNGRRKPSPAMKRLIDMIYRELRP